MAEITPSAMATDLANAYISGAQKLLTTQSQRAQTTSTALTRLQSALRAIAPPRSGLSSKKSLIQRSATITGSAITGASATAGAEPGSYTLFVEKIATSHQVAFEDLPAVPVALGGPLVVKLGDGTDFQVDLSMADQNSDGTISNAEIARAINLAENNGSKVTATTITSGGQTQLVLTAGTSGLAGQITLDASGMPDSTLKTALGGGGNALVAAGDAVVWIGQEGAGIRIQQASNTFTAIDGVTLTLSQAMSSGSTPATLTVTNDQSGTADNVQAFVTAYNALEKALDDLTAVGKDGAASAALASDAGVRALRSRLTSALRLQVGGQSVMDFGIKSSRDGSISLDTVKLQKALAAHPEGLDALFGKASLTSPSGVLGAFQAVSKTWTDIGTGQLAQRQDGVQKSQKRIALDQGRVEMQYTSAYNRYLAQFTRLQNLQSQMEQTSSMFSTLAAAKSS